MFSGFNTALTTVGLALVGVGGGAAVLSIVCLALMNMWAIFDPRMGQGIKGNLVRIVLSGALLAFAGGAAAAMGQITGAAA
jgi:hypothetical protein